MDPKIYIYTHRISSQILILILILMILVEIFKFDFNYYLNINIISLITAIIYAYSSYKLKHEKYIQKIIISLFFISAIGISLSNFFFFEYMSSLHPIFYSILIGQILVFPFLLKEIPEKKKDKNSKLIFKILIGILIFIIVVISFFLRMSNADIIYPERDSSHHFIAALAIMDSGSSVYATLPYINYMLAFLFETFGQSFLIARLPFIIAGVLSVFLIYLIGRKISNLVGIISAVLFAICPWAIGLSRYVRDYSFNIFYELLFIVILLYFPKNIKEKKGLIIFALLNILIYGFLVIFARFQKGLTISIIIALLIVTFIRIVADFEILQKIRGTKIDMKKLNYIIISGVFLLCIAIAILIVFGFYRRITFTYQPMWFFFFLSEVTHPMLWYSFMQVPWFFIFILTVIPIIFLYKNKYVWISFLIFYTYLIFFVFIAKPHSSFLYARYIYPALPFFTILLGISISFILKFPLFFSKDKILRIIYFLGILLFLGSVFNINNTIYTINTNVMSIENDGRQVISVAYWDYSELLKFMEDNNFTKNDIIIASELRIKNIIAWHFDMDFYQNRTVRSFNYIRYDLADNMYVIEVSSLEAIINNPNGWIVRRDGESVPEEIFVGRGERVELSENLKNRNIKIEYLGKYSDKYEVYRWYLNE